MTRALLTIAGVVALTYATRSFVPRGATITGSGAALAFGFLLICAIQAARVFEKLHLPHLTAYILVGLVFGPEVLGIISARMLPDLALVKGTAVGLIAFLAGCELNLRRLAPRLRAISAVTLLSMVFSAVLLFALMYGVTFILPIAKDFTTWQRVVVALACANVLAAYSPAVVIGLISETRAKGPLTEMVMSVVVIADLIIVVTYAISSALARNAFPGGAAAGLGLLVPHIFGSILAGAILGALLAVYARRVGLRSGMFTVAVLFVAAEAGAALHLNPLLVGLAAGLFLENVSPVGGEALSRGAESVALPTFAIFFAVVGAEVHMKAFLHVAPFAVAAAVLRAIGIFAGTRLAARVAGLDPLLARRVAVGLLPQAGVAIALAALMLSDHKPWGSVFGTVILGTIVVNQLVAPVLFKNAIVAAGEAHGHDDAEDTLTPSPTAAPPHPVP